MSGENMPPLQSLLWSVKNGELSDVKALITKEKGLVNMFIEGRSPLHFAADYGHRDVIEFLVDNGADVNKEDKHGITPLLAAIWEGHKSSVDILLKKGARKNGKAPDGTSYLECAETDEIKLLLK